MQAGHADQQSYLFITWEGGGNVPPVLGLAQRLVARGHRVRILTEPCLSLAVRAIGAEFIPFVRHFTRTDRTQDMIQDWRGGPMNMATFDNVIVGPAAEVAAETVAALRQSPTDVVVADLMMAGSLIAAEAEGVASVALFHMPEYLPGPNRPPGGFGLNPWPGPWGRARDRVLGWLFGRVTARYLTVLNQVRAQWGLAPVASFADIYHGAGLRLMQTSRAFDFPLQPAPDNVRYVGPILDDPDWAQDQQVRLPEDDGTPLVVVSLSSTFQNQQATLQNLIAAIGRLPVRGLVTLGPAMAKEQFEAPKNLTLLPSYPHSRLFPRAQLVVTHAGHGTLMRALASSVPLVCLPMGRDQNDNAARVVCLGAGVKLSPKARPAQMADAITRVLNEPDFARNARRLSAAILDDVRTDKASDELEQLARRCR